MLESGGKVPILNPLELEEIGYKLVAYPISLIGVSIQAMQVTIFLFLPIVCNLTVLAKRLKNYVEHLQDALLAIKGGRIPPPGSMPSLKEIEEVLGVETYQQEEKRYATSSSDRGES